MRGEQRQAVVGCGLGGARRCGHESDLLAVQAGAEHAERLRGGGLVADAVVRRRLPLLGVRWKPCFLGQVCIEPRCGSVSELDRQRGTYYGVYYSAVAQGASRSRLTTPPSATL